MYVVYIIISSLFKGSIIIVIMSITTCMMCIKNYYPNDLLMISHMRNYNIILTCHTKYHSLHFSF